MSPSQERDSHNPAAFPSGSRDAEGPAESAAVRDVQERLRRAASVDRPGLILGERGPGKTTAARRLHHLSRRAPWPFVQANCAAISPFLIGPECFGYEEGDGEGKDHHRTCLINAANGGTLLLDEIPLMPPDVQEKTLHVIESEAPEGARAGSDRRANARIVATATVDPRGGFTRGRLAPALLDALSFEVLLVPPLRERRDDIPLLARHFAERMTADLGREGPPSFSPEVLESLAAHDWPGNVRELRTVIERAVWQSPGATIEQIAPEPLCLPDGLRVGGGEPARDSGAGGEDLETPALADARRPEPFPDALSSLDHVSLPAAVRAVELHFMRRALQLARHNQRVAAEALGLSYDQFRGLYRKYADTLKPPEGPD